ncbi:hypothetical protein [Sinimarinibacterium thermocellulolyticum]|uniref:Lipoprotein n=1 Tax=Sinimarinibacterium thermocellulolyticum TaxID=3170016 RepID=A0ABV2AC18_9GAMM
MMRKTSLAAVLGAATLGIAACGGGGNGGPSPTPTPTASPTPTPTPGTNVCDETFVTCDGDNAIIGESGQQTVIDKNFTLTGDKNWFLSGFVLVGNGNSEITSDAQASALKANRVTLTIPAGTHVRGLDDGALIVTRAGRIDARGTATNPITFSSARDENFDGVGEWGGVVIQGWARGFGLGGTGDCTGGTRSYCNVRGEGGVGRWGGNDDADDSGVFTYVRIAEGGLIESADSEVNGLTLQGVGHGTEIHHIQIHNNQDDGVEWFGGTVNVTHLLLTGNDDDAIDYDEGWRGNVQYALVIQQPSIQAAGNDPRGIEAGSDDDKYVPQTSGALANLTIIGIAGNQTNEAGLRLRGASKTRLYNSAVTGFTAQCARIQDADIDGSGPGTTTAETFAAFTNVLGSDCATVYATGSNRHPPQEGDITFLTNIDFDANFAITNPEAQVMPMAMAPVDNGSGFAFEQTDYIGAVKPGQTPWWQGWALPGTVAIPSAN